MHNRNLSQTEIEHIRNKMIKCKDKAGLKRLKKKLIKLEEYKWLMKEYRKSKYNIITY